MGNCNLQPDIPKPSGTPANVCTNANQEDIDNGAVFDYNVPNSCMFGGAPGDTSGPTQCPNDEEWSNVGRGNQCGTDSLNNGKELGTGNGSCCKGHCSWIGTRRRCRRIAFNGDPTTCCLLEGQCNYVDSMSGRQVTCQAKHRGFTQPACAVPMAEYCSNDVDNPYKDKWGVDFTTSQCRRYAQDNFDTPEHYVPAIDAMARRYLITENNQILSPGNAGFDPFIETVVDTCRSFPGSCDAVLEEKCTGVTREQLARNPNLAKLCGCFMPTEQYGTYSSFGVERKCDPACTLGEGVKAGVAPGTSNESEICDQTICVIDNVKLDILGGSNTGDITFAQACGNCGGESCRCFITNTTLTAVDSRIGDVSVTQRCGGEPQCFLSDFVPGAAPIPVDCDDPRLQLGQEGAASIPTSVTTSSTDSGVTLLYVAGIIAAVILALLVLYTVFSAPILGVAKVVQAPRVSKPLVS